MNIIIITGAIRTIVKEHAWKHTNNNDNETDKCGYEKQAAKQTHKNMWTQRVKIAKRMMIVN